MTDTYVYGTCMHLCKIACICMLVYQKNYEKEKSIPKTSSKHDNINNDNK